MFNDCLICLEWRKGGIMFWNFFIDIIGMFVGYRVCKCNVKLCDIGVNYFRIFGYCGDWR